MAIYKAGVIGHTGRGNYGHGLDTVWLHLPECEIVGVADADEAGLQAAVNRLNAPKGYSDYRKMLDDAKPDVVSICPRWLDQHRDMALAAIERGIHVYMEKPFCRTLAEADEIVAACDKHNVKLAVAHQTRYSPMLQAVRDIIYYGKIGEILELRGRGKEDHRGGGEDLWVLGSHIMNLIETLGGDPSWCFASVLSEGEPITAGDVSDGNEGIGPLAGDAVRAMYGLPDGVTAYFASHRKAGTAGTRFGLQIFGSEGIVELMTGYLPQVHFLPDPAWSPGRSGKEWLPVSSAGIGEPEPLRDGGLAAGNILACTDLLAAIETGRLPECNQYEARRTIEMISAVFESQRVGGPVTLPLKTRENPLRLLK